MFRRALVYLSEHQWLQRRVLTTPAARRAAARFVAGDTLDEAIPAVRALNRRGLQASLNYLGEKALTHTDALAAAQAYVAVLQTIRSEDLACNLSVKLTQLGLDLAPEQCEASLRQILTVARQTDNFVRIDMESGVYVDRTLDLYRRLHQDGFDNVGIVLQAYLYRTERDLENLLSLRPRVRLVKGAYAEPASLAYPKKADVDASYRRLTERLLQAATLPAIATHDERLIDYAKAVAKAQGLAPTSFEFQMIYGVRRDLQERLGGEGYRARVYVPFGTKWFPYFMRRLAERPANMIFVLRALLRESRSRRGVGGP